MWTLTWQMTRNTAVKMFTGIRQRPRLNGPGRMVMPLHRTVTTGMRYDVNVSRPKADIDVLNINCESPISSCTDKKEHGEHWFE